MAEPYLSMLSEIVNSVDLGLADRVTLECSHFFSGAALYADGAICGSLTSAGLALKLPADDRRRLIEAGNAGELRYFEKSPIKKEYAVLAPSIVGDADRLASWLDVCLRYTLDLASSD